MSGRTHVPLTANRSVPQRARYICTCVLCRRHLSQTGALPGTQPCARSRFLLPRISGAQVIDVNKLKTWFKSNNEFCSTSNDTISCSLFICSTWGRGGQCYTFKRRTMGVFTDPSGCNRTGLLESAVFTSPAKIQGRTWGFKEVEEPSLIASPSCAV